MSLEGAPDPASAGGHIAVLGDALDAVVTTDAEGRIVEANQAIETLLGWPAEEVVGMRVGDLLAEPARAEHEAALHAYLAGGRADATVRRVEVEARRKDGSTLPVELTATRVDLPDGPTLITFLRDVTEQRRLDAERRRLLEAETTARVLAESAWRRLRLVSEVSELLALSLRYPETFDRLAERIVLDIADLCLIDTVDESGRIDRVAARHRDRSRQRVASRLLEEFAPEPTSEHPVPRVIHTARSQFSPIMTEDFLRATCRNEEHYQVVRELGFQSYISVPLIARARTLGALTLVSTDPARRYGEQDLAVAEEIARRASVRIDNARLYDERNRVAHVLQQGLLPQRLTPVPRLEIAARYFAAGEGIEAGGDFYDVFQVSDDRWALVIGDVSGKGPEAAAYMGLARPALRALARAHRRPARVLRTLNAELLDHGVEGRFLTVAYVQVRPGTEGGVGLTACLAGHPPGILVSADGEVSEVGAPGTMLAAFEDVELVQDRRAMAPGDVLLLYTDGLADEQPSHAAIALGELRALLAAQRTTSSEAIAARLQQLVEQRDRERRSGRDDIAFLVVRCVGERRGV
ncbi:MAG TPA: SpoIIE family protein phosphatase [Gaiellales bacterium]|nr:SpoIIE family protein phosphatase [Gaiellales bacterium]